MELIRFPFERVIEINTQGLIIGQSASVVSS